MSDDGEHPHGELPSGGRASRATGTGRLVGGRYRLAERVGSGGMGTVWRAVDELVDREVAVKQPRLPGDTHGSDSPHGPGSPGSPDGPGGPEHDARRRAANRLYREARAAARVDHPSAVTIHDVVVEGGAPWIVMELVRGESLHEVLKRGALSPVESARIGLAVVGALHAAHAVGIVHRDVKPANVLLGPHGQVVLTDFGIAHVQGEESLTVTGEFVGSLEFVAPERMAGPGAAGPPSDLWSLGVLLYAAVEGWSPFRRTSLESTLAAILSAEPPVPERAGPLGPLLVRLLTKDPALRPDAEETAGYLRDVAEERVPDAQTPFGLSELGEDSGTLRLGVRGADHEDARDVRDAHDVPDASDVRDVHDVHKEDAPVDAPERAPETAVVRPEAAGETEVVRPEPPSETEVVRPEPAHPRRRAPVGRLVAVTAAGLLLAGGGAWAGVALDEDSGVTEVAEPQVGWADARVASPSPSPTPGTTAGTRWVAHREAAMDAVLSLPGPYERIRAEGGGDEQPRVVTYEGEKVVRVRLTQWDEAPASPMEQAKDATDIVTGDVKSTAQYTTTSFHDQEAVLADTTHHLDGTPTRVLELIVRTDDDRMYELRVDMPKGTADEKKGTAVFKGARQRLEIGP
ncbi:serine/threonine-protein kinase [Streptomyces caniscabiei]|nr:serine/threonine protein kinase [Streptomyces caniscabiei]MBE4757661.1 serine/threonine protein kinase [Streptomyces caniscabiei]MBE4770947.1 serine/threonine protein kinase [Streptomyces caniscabiei]MBE4786780.1 serine/threonine protein kinase [Streptomyces caniscabiei]MBE4794966.1 serine/threonine protein kinase [Streptomyces caniscabiei]